MQMPGRKYSNGSGYRYGFNGQEKSDDVTVGNYTAMYWEYDSRIGRRWNLDPVPKTGQSDYACFDNNPINLSDVDGDDPGKPGKKSKGYDWVSALHYQAIHYNGARIAFNIYKARQQFGHYGTKYNAAYKNTIGTRAAKSYKEHDMVVTGIDEAAYAKVIQGYYESFEKGFNWAGDRTVRELDFIFKNKLYGAATDVFKPTLSSNEAYFAIHQSMALLDDLTGTAYTIGAWGEEVFMKCAMFTAAWATSGVGSGASFSSVVAPGLQPNRSLIRTNPRMPAATGGQKASDVVEYAAQNNGASRLGYKGGGTFANDGRGGGQILPQTGAGGSKITYKEYDVNPFQKGVNRGGQRVVIGSDGKAFYTSNHYRTFTLIK